MKIRKLSPAQERHLAEMHAAHIGTHHSAETRAKMSAAKKGKKVGPFSPEHRAALSAALAGRKVSQETRAKVSAALKRRWTSPEYRAWQSDIHKGNQNALGRHRPHSLATRARMSAAQKGRKHGPMSGEQRAKISAANKGKCLGRIASPETKAKMSAAHKGRRLSPGHRARIGNSRRGSKHPLWRGGISREPYGWEWNAELKEEVRRRDGYCCQLCGAPEAECKGKLVVHHINYVKRDNDPLNLVALCRSCHSRTNFRRDYWTAFFEAKP